MASKNSAKFDFAQYIENRRLQIEAALDQALSLDIDRLNKLKESMRYSLLNGGKRLRPILCLAACELAGGTVTQAMPTSVALEMIHISSLIHDDLPPLGNYNLRRGRRPTNHKVYGEAMAILAGNSLLVRAFEKISLCSPDVPAERLLAVVGELSLASGASGLMGGQAVGLEFEGKEVDLDTLEYIHLHKTGSLLRASVVSGAIIGGADENLIEALEAYAKCICLSFQISDDILDFTANAEVLGKTDGRDLIADKSTYPKLLGLARCRRRVKSLVTESKQALEPYNQNGLAEPLLALIDYIVNRAE
jgi:geranylgeranyl diphosphate synthase type II